MGLANRVVEGRSAARLIEYLASLILIALAVFLIVSDPALAERGCRRVQYAEPGHPSWLDNAFAIKLAGAVSCSQAGAVVTYPLWGYDGTRRHGARGLHGFRHAGLRCSARTVHPIGKGYIVFSCHATRRWIQFRWNSV
jgi:hypothetical protein